MQGRLRALVAGATVTSSLLLLPATSGASTAFPTTSPVAATIGVFSTNASIDTNCFNSATGSHVSNVGIFYSGLKGINSSAATTNATSLLLRISNPNGQFLPTLVSELASSCASKTVSAWSADSSGWIKIPIGVVRVSRYLFNPNVLPSKSVIEYAFANAGGVGPESLAPMPPTQPLNVAPSPSVLTCATLTLVGGVGLFAHIALNALAAIFPEMPWVQDVNNATNIAVTIESQGLAAALPKSTGEVVVDYSNAKSAVKDAVAGINKLAANGIKATLKAGSKTVITFAPLPAAGALDLATELTADKAEAEGFYNAAKGIGCSW